MKKYSVIYADPPWQYRTYSKKGQGRSAESHYPTMSIEDIKVKLPSGKGSERGEATSRKDADMREPERRWKSRNTGSTALNSPTKATGKWRRKKD